MAMLPSVGFVVTDVTYGVAYYRALLPARTIETLGHHVVCSDIVRQTPAGTIALGVVSADASAPEIGVEPDVIVLVGGVTYDIDPDLIDDARANGQRVLVDCDDLPFLPQKNHAWRPDFAQRRVRAIGQADGVICSTPYIEQRLRSRSRVQWISRNTIDTAPYNETSKRNVALARARRRARQPVIRVGWRGGTPWHDGDVRELRGVASAYTDSVRYVHVGHIDPRHRLIGCSHDTDSIDAGATVWCGECLAKRPVTEPLPPTFAQLAGLDDDDVETRELVPMAEYQQSLGGVDLAVVPLAPVPFNYAKSCVAALEWTAAGVPWVASATPEYEWLDAASTVRRSRDWARMLGRLIHDADLRAEWAARQAATLDELELAPGSPRALAAWRTILSSAG